MDDLSARWFGLIIAYVLPGLVFLVGLEPHSATIHAWFNAAGDTQTGLAGFFHVVAVATAAGVVIGCVRWLLIDSVHAYTGIVRPAWNESALTTHFIAYDLIVEHHYRYYQSYAGMLLVLPLTYISHRLVGTSSLLGWGSDVAMVFLEVALFAGSRDALRKYYTRALNLLGPAPA